MEKSKFWPVRIFVEGSFLPFCMADSAEEAMQKIISILNQRIDISSIKAKSLDHRGREIELLDCFMEKIGKEG